MDNTQPAVKLRVQQTDGSTIEHEVGSLSVSVGELKASLSERTGIPAEKIRLMLDSQILGDDEQPIRHYGEYWHAPRPDLVWLLCGEMRNQALRPGGSYMRHAGVPWRKRHFANQEAHAVWYFSALFRTYHPISIGIGNNSMLRLVQLARGQSNHPRNVSGINNASSEAPMSPAEVMGNQARQMFMSNPQLAQTLMMSNPQMREAMENNPELRQMMTDPE
ncbi:hypothetical protein IWW52_006693, partial [Coemansia sp. RSA 2704]